ncbi:3756_t:CDS:1 [Ambispora leptoticha]|uniref:3756_t:CDS:1 n=1 Tax=Ambispora leptoticha TaxID=144679 RepID=A0A9N9GY94_9GLOM|nr:3756_t:CDS:1 [Ambispora leptoticha]
MKLEKEGRKTNSPSLLELSNNVKEVGEKYVQVGVKAGGHIPLIEQIGGLCGLGGALYHGTLVSGMKIVDDGKEVYNKALDTGAGLMESTGKNLTQVTETFVDKGADMIKNIGGDIANVTGTIASNIADVNKKVVEEGSSLVKEGMKTGADTVENFRKGVENVTTEAMNNTTKVINESIDVAKKVVEGGIGAKYGDFEFGVNMGKGNVLEAKVESKDEIIARLEKQLEEQKLELTKKQEQINFLQQQQAEAQKTSGQTGLAALQLAQTLAANK